jgi:hypothetical protein
MPARGTWRSLACVPALYRNSMRASMGPWPNAPRSMEANFNSSRRSAIAIKSRGTVWDIAAAQAFRPTTSATRRATVSFQLARLTAGEPEVCFGRDGQLLDQANSGWNLADARGAFQLPEGARIQAPIFLRFLFHPPSPVPTPRNAARTNNASTAGAHSPRHKPGRLSAAAGARFGPIAGGVDPSIQPDHAIGTPASTSHYWSSGLRTHARRGLRHER